jgi:hypothetical protein
MQSQLGSTQKWYFKKREDVDSELRNSKRRRYGLHAIMQIVFPDPHENSVTSYIRISNKYIEVKTYNLK